MSKMSLKEIQAKVAAYVDATKQAGVWNSSYANVAGLLDKIGKMVQLDGIFADKLGILDGEMLPYGKTIEEWYADLCAVSDYSDNPSDPMSPAYPEYEDPAYSYTLGRKKIKTTFKYNDYERACTNSADFVNLANSVLKRLSDTEAMFKYDAKKQLLKNGVAKVLEVSATTGATAYVTGAALTKGTRYYNGTEVGICKKAASAEAGKTWSDRIAAGNIVVYTMVGETIAKPVDTSTSEAFIKRVKNDVETAQFATEGNSLNGNAVGAENGLVLFIAKGINAVIDVDALSGAFHQEKLALPAQIIVVDEADFGSNVYGILTDSRTFRLHNTYKAIREQLLADADAVNYVLHTENTAFYSKNTFIKVYKAA